MARRNAPKNPVTEQDCERFDQFVVKWQAILNLSDWKLSRAKARSKDLADIFGIEPEHRLASYSVGRSFGDELVTPRRIEELALHETLHLFLHGISYATSRYGADSDEVLAEEHRIITVLMPLLEHLLTEE